MRKTNKTLTLILTLVMILTITYQPIEASAASAKPVVKVSQKVISKGTTTKLKVTYSKKNITNKAKFKTSNKKVATVSKKGIVTGKKAGTAYITATYKGKTSKKVKITVAQVSLNKSKVKLTVGKTATLTAKYNGKKVKPTYKSSNPNVASVNKNGKITAKKKGTATITAVYKKTKVSCKVTITEADIKHITTKTVVKQPTCTEEGITECRCTCGDVWTETIPALGHAWDDGVITKEPTDSESGVKTYTCGRCGDTKEENGHYEKRETKKAWDEEVTEGVIICNGCNKEFSPNSYGEGDAGVEAALDALTIHAYTECDMNTGKQGYHTETRTITIHHDAEYGDVWVADK